jgi:biotin-(acetyl-CoA carboxylase) ligase
VLFKPPASRRAPELSLVAGIAVADTVERTIGLAAQIKWPNDVMLRRAKVAGCLAEARGGAVVLGIGINVNQTREELPPVTGSPPGSLLVATGQEWPRAPLLAMLLGDLERCYSEWLAGGLGSLYPYLGSRDFLRGRHVSVNGTSGTAVKIDRAGRLEIAVRQPFHRALRADRHERRRRDFSMRRRHQAAACAAIAVRHAKSEACHRPENSLQSQE